MKGGGSWQVWAHPEEAAKLPYLISAFSDAHDLVHHTAQGDSSPLHEARWRPSLKAALCITQAAPTAAEAV